MPIPVLRQKIQSLCLSPELQKYRYISTIINILHNAEGEVQFCVSVWMYMFVVVYDMWKEGVYGCYIVLQNIFIYLLAKLRKLHMNIRALNMSATPESQVEIDWDTSGLGSTIFPCVA